MCTRLCVCDLLLLEKKAAVGVAFVLTRDGALCCGNGIKAKSKVDVQFFQVAGSCSKTKSAAAVDTHIFIPPRGLCYTYPLQPSPSHFPNWPFFFSLSLLSIWDRYRPLHVSSISICPFLSLFFPLLEQQSNWDLSNRLPTSRFQSLLSVFFLFSSVSCTHTAANLKACNVHIL